MIVSTIPMTTETDLTKTIASVPAPVGVRLRRVYFDTDHMGDPAVRIVFGTSKKFAPTRERIKELVAYKMAVSAAVLGLDIAAFPYIEFVDAR